MASALVDSTSVVSGSSTPLQATLQLWDKLDCPVTSLVTAYVVVEATGTVSDASDLLGTVRSPDANMQGWLKDGSDMLTWRANGAVNWVVEMSHTGDGVYAAQVAPTEGWVSETVWVAFVVEAKNSDGSTTQAQRHIYSKVDLYKASDGITKRFDPPRRPLRSFDVGGDPSVSYTHLTLPTICSV